MASGAAASGAARPRRSTEEVINEILKKVLRVSVQIPDASGGPGVSPAADPGGGVVVLDQLAAELLSESKALLLSADTVERALMARLDPHAGAAEPGAPGSAQSPLQYCLGAYERAVEEGRKVAGIKDKERLAQVQAALETCKDLLLSYALLALQHPDMFSSSATDQGGGSKQAVLWSTSPLTDLIAGPYTPPARPDPALPAQLQAAAAAGEGAGGQLGAHALQQAMASVLQRMGGAAGPGSAFNPSWGQVAHALAALASGHRVPLPRRLPSGMSSSAPTTSTVGNPVANMSAPGSGLPSGFLEELLKRTAEEEDGDEGGTLQPIVNPIFDDLAYREQEVSLIGAFQAPLRALVWLSSFPSLARALAQHPRWVPPRGPVAPAHGSEGAGQDSGFDGRLIEMQSILGPFLHVSVLNDPLLGNGDPDVIEQLFSKPSERRSAELSSSYIALRTAARQIWEGVHEVLKTLLKAPALREPVLQMLAAFINRNANRSQLQMDPRKVASDGTFFNLGAIMLKLCEPFLASPTSLTSPAGAAKLEKLDPTYVLSRNGRLDLSGLTALHATSNEIVSWVDQRNYARQESFRQVQQQREAEELQRLQQAQQGGGGIEAALGAAPANPFAPAPVLPTPVTPLSRDSGAEASSSSPASFEGSRSGQGGATELAGAPDAPGARQYGFICECFFMTARVLHLGLVKVNSDFREFSQRMGRQDREALRVLEAMRGPGEPPDLERQIAAHKERLDRIKEVQLCYDVALRDPELVQQAVRFFHLMLVWLASLVGGFRLPLPAPCPMEFAAMPEHFVEDALDTMLLASSMQHALDNVPLDDFMSFIVMFMGSPLHIKNPYLRAKMVELLRFWMPAHCPTPAMAASMASLFEGHPLVMQHLTPNLLRLFVDIEFTGSHTAFYDKFNIRANIAELLEYLWEVPSHRRAWIAMSVVEERSFYLRFLSLLINDSIYLLDDALEKIPKLKEEEAAQADQASWLQLPLEERRTREEQFQRDQQHVKSDMQLADVNVRMIEYSTTNIVKPFLLPEMVERVAAMLNYFLLQLVGAKRKALRVSDPEKYGFQPKKLLSQIVTIYVHLSRGDKQGAFAEAISADGRSYREEAFGEAAAVTRKNGLLDEGTVREFVRLGERAKVAAEQAQDLEDQLDDIPSEFLDPVQFTLMKDPVILPSGNVMDRAVILRHLLSDPKDPFTRAHLTPEMLQPHTALKERIDAFLIEQKQLLAKQRQANGEGGTGLDPMDVQ